jgi:tRNA modification GTPase
VLGGVPVTLLDTAGLHEATDPVEAEGVRRALARAAAADVVVQVLPPAGGYEQDTILARGRIVRVAGKADLLAARPAGVLAVSGTTGEGLEQLREVLSDEATRLTRSEGAPPLTRARHRSGLTEAHERLASAAGATAELRGEDLRLALRAIGRVTGAVGVEDVLDSIFRQFCIGK